MDTYQLTSILGPTIGVIFTLFLLPLWLNNRSRSYILYFAGCFIAYTLATGSHFLLVPGDGARGAPITSVLYLICIALLSEGGLKRLNRSLNYPVVFCLCGLTLAGVLYFYYIDKNLIARIYILSTGCSLLLAMAAYRLRPSRGAHLIDKIIFAVFVLMSAQILIRPLLAGSPGNTGADLLSKDTPLFWLALYFSLIVSAVVMGLTLLAAIVVEMMTDLKRQSLMDSLTGVYNRRGFDEKAADIIANGLPGRICLVVCDIDHFKSINDLHGHPRGDRVLKDLAGLLTAHAGRDDIVGRIGGEEFAILLTATTTSDAWRFAERVRMLFEDAGTASFRGTHPTTASFGIAFLQPEEPLSQLMSRADKQLYAAKKTGRNRVCSDDDQAIDYRATA